MTRHVTFWIHIIKIELLCIKSVYNLALSPRIVIVSKCTWRIWYRQYTCWSDSCWSPSQRFVQHHPHSAQCTDNSLKYTYYGYIQEYNRTFTKFKDVLASTLSIFTDHIRFLEKIIILKVFILFKAICKELRFIMNKF